MYLLQLLKEIPDTRGTKGREFPLAEILFMVILGAACGYTSYRKLENFIECKWDIFRKHLKIKRVKPPKYNGLRSIILSVNNNEFEKAFRKHAFSLVNMDNVKHIAADGKTMRSTRDFQIEDSRGIQFLNLFAVNENIILAHEVIDKKTNEIPVFQTLINELGISNKIFTADALHCQKKL
ncbi:MAG: ISAs1 family transposase [Burkholderiales bacterium]|jgi:hypothetical protein|nr:ISAs1 family transposase [Burkholderiales bacterium]